MDMRLGAPRILPLPPSEWTEEQRAALKETHERGQWYNNWGTLARNWDAYVKLQPWGRHLSHEISLPHREREIAELRTAWLCRAKYVWDQHVVIGKHKGLTDDEIARIQEGPDAAGWQPFDAALVRAADELVGDAFISDATWRILAARYSPQQMMDLIFAIGTYTMVSMCMNSLGVQMDATFKGA